MIFAEDDFQTFKNWLDLDINSITWEGRSSDSFFKFWKSLFKEEISPLEMSQRFDYARKLVKSGPLISWLTWLYEKFLVYVYIHFDVSVRELALKFGLEEKYLSLVIRDHLIKVYPLYEDLINERFMISNVRSENLFLRFQDISSILGPEATTKGSFEEEVFTKIEVTLYPEWPSLVKELSKDIISLKIDFDNFKKRGSFKNQVRFVQEVTLLLLFLSVVVFSLKNVNHWYENYLVNKITLFEPNFFWLDKSLTYQDQDLLAKDQIDLSNKELEDLERIEAQKVFADDISETRYDPESDVVILNSIEEVPKSFLDAESEKSLYEETKKGGLRGNSLAASKYKAYRIMMTSVEPDGMKNRILPLLEKFGVSQVDNVKPGTEIPGGIYFNLHVPSQNLKEFMSEVSAFGEATIFESRAQGRDEPGKNRVFIWVKSI